MKKYFLVLLFIFVVFLSGCGKSENINENKIIISKPLINENNKENFINRKEENIPGLIYICKDKDCILNKFKNCEVGQYVIDEKKEFKAYFLVNGLIEKDCVLLIEKDFKNGMLCKLPNDINRDDVLFNNLLSYKFDSVKDYCKNIFAEKSK